MMKKIKIHILLIFCTLYSLSINAQVSLGGNPLSFEHTNILVEYEKLPTYVLPKKDNKVLSQKYEELGCSEDAYGEHISVDIDIIKSGKWEKLPTGENICRFRVKSETAYGLRFIFSAFKMPQGSKLFVYDEKKEHLLGAFSSKNNKPSLHFATREIEGKNIILEYNSGSSNQLPILKLKNIAHIFRDFQWLNRDDFEESLPCHNDVNCEPFASEWCNEIRSVVKFSVIKQFENLETGEITITELRSHCTGTIINNSKQDFDPLILTAAHCILDEPQDGRVQGGVEFEETWVQPENWVVFYNFQSPSCQEESQNGNDLMTTTGVERLFIGNPSTSDGGLLRVTDNNGRIPLQYNVFYAGWNIENTLNGGDEVVGIHHPKLDVKKITEQDFSYFSGSSQIVTSVTNGILQEGSSGSPLFDTNTHQVVGTLMGNTPRETITCETTDFVYGNISDYFNAIQPFIADFHPPLAIPTSVEGADPIGVCQDDIELFDNFFPGNDWQSHNPIKIQAANSISTELNTDEVTTQILSSSSLHSNLNNTSDYTLRAGNVINLKAGFKVEKGNKLHALIGECEEFEGCGFNSNKRAIVRNNNRNHKDFEQIKNIKLYPNPTNGQFTLELSTFNNQEQTLLFISDITGKVVQTLEIVRNQTLLDISHLTSGIYYIQVVANNKTYTEKLVLTR